MAFYAVYGGPFIPYYRKEQLIVDDFHFTMIGRVDIEESKSNVAMNTWLDNNQVIFKIKQVWEYG